MDSNVSYNVTSNARLESTSDVVYDTPGEGQALSAGSKPSRNKNLYTKITATIGLLIGAFCLVLILALIVLVSRDANGTTLLNQNPGMALDEVTQEPDELPTTVMNDVTEEQAETTTPMTLGCPGTGWNLVALINMTDPDWHCPSGFFETPYSIRACGRNTSTSGTIIFVNYETQGLEYGQVCGRIKAYRYGYNRAFFGYSVGQTTVDRAYVDGITITHRLPRQHIWTFASGLFVGRSIAGDPEPNRRCPCDQGNTYTSPPFVGSDYFCESVASPTNYNVNPYRFYSNNPLWDGTTDNDCDHPKWFVKQLPNSTSDSIEVRITTTDQASNIAIELMQLYVK